MKKTFGILVVMTLLAILPANAQGVSFGLKGGVNSTNLTFDSDILSTERRVGWFVGPSLKVSLPISSLGVDIAAFYDQKESKVGQESIKQQSIIVPVNLRLNLGLGSMAGIYGAVGPQFGFNVGDDTFKWTDKDSYESTFQLKKSSFSINLGAGVYLSKHLEVGFTYNIALGSTADASFKNSIQTATSKSTYEDDSKAKSWTISAAYYF